MNTSIYVQGNSKWCIDKDVIIGFPGNLTFFYCGTMCKTLFFTKFHKKSSRPVMYNDLEGQLLHVHPYYIWNNPTYKIPRLFVFVP